MATELRKIAIACQGGGSHTAFTAGVLKRLLPELPDDHEVVGLSGTSGGALCATTAWYGLLADGPDGAAERLDALWEDLSAGSLFERSVNEAVVLTEHLDSMGVPIAHPSPYDVPGVEAARRELRSAIEAQVEFDRFPELVAGSSPRLLVSAVDVVDGSFDVFEDETVTADHVLASAAVPSLFPAVEIDGQHYWDGLFSQNPPIRDFLTGEADPERKPDEIWIVQINPEETDAVPTRSEAIADRRNELSGNLSLNQEVEFIETVNGWVADGSLPADRYKHVDVEWIRLERELSYASKLDRDPSFLAELIADGEAAAEAFLEERDARPVPAQ